MATGLVLNRLTAVANAVANRQEFAKDIAAGMFDTKITEVSSYESVGGGKNKTVYDASGYVEKGIWQTDNGQTLSAGSLKGYSSLWDITLRSKPIVLTANDIDQMESNDYNPMDYVQQAGQSYILDVEGSLANTIERMNGAGVGAAITARYEDNATHKNWFDTGHIMGGTTYANHLTNKIDAVDATHLGYFEAAVDAWEKLPGINGKEGGLGNRWSDNGMVICATNVANVIRAYAGRRTIAVNDDNYLFYNNLPYVALPGLANDTVIITRRASNFLPGFRWIEAYRDAVVTPPSAMVSSIAWRNSIRYATIGTIHTASLLNL